MSYIYSTLSSDQLYTLWITPKNEGMLPKKKSQVLIKGKANVADKNFITPRGMVTSVSDEELKQLEANSQFRKHVERSFIKVEAKKANVDKAVKDMEARDASAPLTADSFKAEDAPTLNKVG